MGAECIGLNDDSAGIPSVPPGFAPLTSFTLQRIQDDVMDSAHSDPMQIHMDIDCAFTSNEKFKKSLRHRPWVNYKKFDGSSGEEESDSDLFEQRVPLISRLPKGVLRGCAQCTNCQKVTARWRPDDACRPHLDEAPVFYPTEEEFKDTLRYIASIRLRAEPYGICRIVPPPSWKPPCPLKNKGAWENVKFTTRVQQVDKLQNRDSVNKLCKNTSMMKRKRQKFTKMGAEFADTVVTNKPRNYNDTERFGFEPGPDFTLESFQKYADEFQEQYFRTVDVDQDSSPIHWEPSVENIEGEYWRIVEKPTEEIEVLYGADLETGVFGSGFPKRTSAPLDSDLVDKYVESGWNLNNLSRLPGSVLSFEKEDISGVLVPWLYIGMCFSSFCWHVEDHHLYSLNYMHWGAPKLWYGIPASDALKLEGAMKKHLEELFEDQPDLLHNLVTQFSPSMLKLEGVPVYRCVQKPGEFVLTFPRAYHSGFNCGFNCAEAVNVAPVDWLPHGLNAIELYREQGRKISISHDKLLLGAAREAVRSQWNFMFLKKNTLENSVWKDISGPEGILAKALKARVDMEHIKREYLCSSESKKMDVSFDSNSERECVVCHYDLHLSAAGCPCSPEKFACLVHAQQLCSCPWKTRFFLYRYEVSEMNVLVDAVGGKLSAVHKWGLTDLGLSLSSHVKKEKSQEPKSSSEGTKPEIETVSCSTTKSYSLPQEIKPSSEVKKRGEKKEGNAVGSSCLVVSDISSPHRQTNTMEPCVQGMSLSGGVQNQVSVSIKGQTNLDLSPSGSSGQGNIATKVDKISSPSGKRDVIVLTDDEHDEPLESLTNKIEKDCFVVRTEILSRLKSFDDKATSCNSLQDRVLTTPETNASPMRDRINMPLAPSTTIKLENQVNTGTPKEDLLILRPSEFAAEEPNDTIIINQRSHRPYPQMSGKGKSDGENNDRNLEMDSDNLMDRGKTVAESSSYISNSPDRCNLLHKGPRMAKVVRRINCSVVPLEYGVVKPGKLWSTSQAIFPKGYRSRVRYLSILDPTQMCYYVSEILDAGLLGPLFMVVVDQHPGEVFIHISATKCWEMVRERVNSEIRRQHSLGKVNLHTLQPPSLDGLEMFGLSSPSIIKSIEEIDREHVCTEYWRSRSQPQPSSVKSTGAYNPSSLPPATNMALRGLFKKANPDELLALQSILRSDVQNSKQEAVQLLAKEFDSRSK